MKVRNNFILKVKKFRLDLPDEREVYENILNDSDCFITRDEFSYDKTGRPVITIWYQIKKGREISPH